MCMPYVNNHGAYVGYVELSVAYGGEVVYLGKVHEREIDIIVDMAEHVDVGESGLHVCAVAEWNCGRGYPRIIGR